MTAVFLQTPASVQSPVLDWIDRAIRPAIGQVPVIPLLQKSLLKQPHRAGDLESQFYANPQNFLDRDIS